MLMKTLGLDIGTTSISAVVYERNVGAVLTRSVPNDSFLPSESWAQLQNPAVILKKATALVEELLECHPDVQAIGVTGQMHGIVYLDRHGDCVSPLYTWQDGRGDLPFDDTASWAEHLSGITGYALSTGYGMVTHFYNLHHDRVPNCAVSLCTIMDYVAMKLAGKTAPVMDPTNAASLGLFRLPQCRFDAQALEKAGIDRAWLPAIGTGVCLGSGSIGIPVYTAIGDNQAAFLGAVGNRRDALLVNVGTGSQIAAFSCEYRTVPGMETRPFPDGGWLLAGASLCGGRSYELLENFFRQTVKMVTGREESVYAAMDRALAEADPVTDYPGAVTAFQGTRQNPNLRGSISGIGIDNFTPLHLMYSFMDGIIRELYEMYRAYLEAGGRASGVIIGSGNGLRKNPHLCRMLERIFDCALTLSPHEEEAACGAAMLAEQYESARRA